MSSPIFTQAERKVSELVQNAINPRTLKDKAFKELKESLDKDREFIKARPIIVSMAEGRENTVIAGNMRLQAIKSLGWATVPVVEVRDASVEQEKEWMVKDNLHKGEWDFEMLANNFDLDFLKDMGFDEKGLNKVLSNVDNSADDEFDVDEAAANETEPVSRLGDLWALGEHRLYCADATDPETFSKLMGRKKFDLLVTDPPYGVSYADKNGFMNAADGGDRNETPIENDHMGHEGLKLFLLAVFASLKPHFADKSAYYVFTPQGGPSLLFSDSMRECGYFEASPSLPHQIIWAKNNHVLGRTDYNYKHEPILYGWVNAHAFVGGGAHKFSVWEIDKPSVSKLHPTMKPVALIENAVLNSTSAGMAVADAFLGSGTTLIACENTGRVCYGMEIDPKYCDVIIRRWEEKTGKKAVKM